MLGCGGLGGLGYAYYPIISDAGLLDLRKAPIAWSNWE